MIIILVFNLAYFSTILFLFLVYYLNQYYKIRKYCEALRAHRKHVNFCLRVLYVCTEHIIIIKQFTRSWVTVTQQHNRSGRKSSVDGKSELLRQKPYSSYSFNFSQWSCCDDVVVRRCINVSWVIEGTA